MSWKTRTSDFLQKDHVGGLYGKLGRILHAANPTNTKYDRNEDYEYFNPKLKLWMDMIVTNLLAVHLIGFPAEDKVWLVKLYEKGLEHDKVKIYPFDKVVPSLG